MTTQPKRGRGRPKKETYATIEAPVEKAEPAEKILPEPEPTLKVNYTGSVAYTPDNPILADRVVGVFEYTNDREIKVGTGVSVSGWKEFQFQITGGIYSYKDSQTGATFKMVEAENPEQWIKNIEQAKYRTPYGFYYVTELVRHYETQ